MHELFHGIIVISIISQLLRSIEGKLMIRKIINKGVYYILCLYIILKVKSKMIPSVGNQHYYGNENTKLSSKCKYLLILCILIPFSIFITQNQYSDITYYTNLINLSYKVSNTLKFVEVSIFEQKVITDTYKQYLVCPQLFICAQYMQVNPSLTEREMKKMCLSSNQINTQAQIQIITILIPPGSPQKQQIMQNYKHIQEEIQKYAQFELHLEIEEISPYKFPKHLRQKIFVGNYREMIAEFLLSSSYLHHCLYTHKSCQNKAIIVQEMASSETNVQQIGSFEQYGSVYFANYAHIEEMVIQILQIDYFTETKEPLRNWQKYLQIKYLYQLQRNLIYLREELWAEKSLMPLDTNNHISNYLQQVDFYLQNNYALSTRHRNPLTRPPSILHSSQINSVDIYPTEYKIGVLLPLIVSFVVFPFMNLIKK